MSHPQAGGYGQQQTHQQQHPYAASQSQPGGYGQQQQHPYAASQSQQGQHPYAASQSQQSQHPYAASQSQQSPHPYGQQQGYTSASSQPQYASQPSANGPYGQNQQYQQQDQQQYNSQQQQQQQYQSSDPYGSPQGDGAMAAAVVVPLGPPPGLVQMSERLHRYIVQDYSNINMICLAVCAFIVFSTAVSLIFEQDIVNIVFLCLALVVGGGISFFTFRREIDFDEQNRVAKVTQKRIFQHFCQPETITVASYSDLGTAGFTGAPGLMGNLYIELGSTQFVLRNRLYQTQAQIDSEVIPWQRYLEERRGHPTGIAGAVRAVANALNRAL